MVRLTERSSQVPRLGPSATILLGLAAGGCSLSEAPILHPDGPVTLIARNLMFQAFWIMMIVAIPVFALTMFFAWRYRASSTQARYERDWTSGWVDPAPGPSRRSSSSSPRSSVEPFVAHVRPTRDRPRKIVLFQEPTSHRTEDFCNRLQRRRSPPTIRLLRNPRI